MTVARMAGTLTAWPTAARTRGSAKMFAPSPPTSPSASCGKPSMMTRASMPRMTCTSPEPSSRAASCTGTGSIRSSSPDSSAATAVALFWTGWKIAVSDVAPLVVPPALEGRQLRAQPGLARRDHVGPGAVRVGRREVALLDAGPLAVVRLRPARVHHHPVGDGVREDRVGRVGVDLDGEGVGRLDARDAREPGARVGLLAAGPLVAEHDVLGVEGRAVMETHALAQGEAPALSLADGLPGGGERGLDGHVAAAPHEPLVDVPEEREDRRGVARVRVERGRIGRGGIAQLGGEHRQRGHHGGGGEEGEAHGAILGGDDWMLMRGGCDVKPPARSRDGGPTVPHVVPAARVRPGADRAIRSLQGACVWNAPYARASRAMVPNPGCRVLPGCPAPMADRAVRSACAANGGGMRRHRS